MSRRAHRWGVLILTTLAAACDAGGGTGPDVNAPVSLQITLGDAQQGLPGETLPIPLTVKVTRADGSPAVGVPVRFTAASGSLEVVMATTTDKGVAFAWWTLPESGGGALEVLAEAAGLNPVRFTAGPLPPDQTELLYTREPEAVNLLLYDAFTQGGYAEGFRARFADSLPVRPFHTPAMYNEVFAFSPGKAPQVSRVAWSSRRDSVQVGFPLNAVVPVTIWIVKAPFEPLAAQSRLLVDSATSVWSRGGIGFEARIVDATGHAAAGDFQGDVEPCAAGLPNRIGADPGRLNVYYVGGIYFPQFEVRGQGVYCGDDVIALAANNTRSPWLLGHEIGHAFGLGHEVEGNLMHGMGLGRHVTAGQIFRAHFDRASTITRLLQIHAREQVRDCYITWDTWQRLARCPPTTFDF